MGVDLQMIICSNCGRGCEYDEAEGNLEDGYVCFECLEEKREWEAPVTICPLKDLEKKQ